LKLTISRYLLRTAFVLTACFLVAVSQSLGQTYDFQKFTVENGLSQSQVLCLFQSNTGELWMGTNQGGINKYNGSDFSYITKEHGLSDNVVYTIAQDQQGRMLVGTNNGLNIILGDRIDILNIEKGLPHKGVVSILIAKDQTIWLGTGKGVGRLVGDSIIQFIEDSLLSASTILNIREGTDGSLWFCTVQNGLFRWNGESMLNITTEQGLDHNYVFDVMPLGKYDAWIFGFKGLYHLMHTKIEPIELPKGIPTHTRFYGYQRDKAKNIWIGTTAGVLKYRDGEFKQLTMKNGLVDNNIWKIIQDREGNMWFGSKSNGVSKLNSERFKIYKSKEDIPYPAVNAVFRDSKNRVWLGTRGGAAIWEGKSRQFVKEKDGLSSEVISDFDEGPDGTIYIGTDYGITTYQDGKFTKYIAKKTDLNDCRDVFVDGSTIWLGTKIGPAVFEQGYISQPFNAVAFPQYVFDAARKGNDIWFGYDDGVLKFDGKQFVQLTAKDGFFDGRTRSVLVGPNGNLWFGTNNGVYRYDGTSCRNFGVAEGLLSDAVYSLGFHPDGSLWVGQAKGVSRLLFKQGELENIIRYGKEQGFLGLECSTNSILMDDDGKILVGTTNGLVEYDPSQDKSAYFKPLTRITDIKLYSQSVDWSGYSDSTNTDGIPFNLVLPYDKNHLTFDFSGVSLTSPASMNYSYILEGMDDDWQPITNNNSAKYSNIPPGTYTFKVRAGFGDELWQNRPVFFQFKVEPPFYRTTWFYLLLVAIAIAIAYSYYTIRRSNIMITSQKLEIELQKDVIEKKNQEMVDSINYASTIQSATLPTKEQWHKLLPDSFVLFKPKDIVSGDFYWLANQGDEIFFSAVDCTGHGVPGALMSIVGYNGLNQAVNEHKLSDPASILRNLSSSVNESLRKSEHDDYVKDGMDIALCKLNFKTLKLEFAGAFNPLLIIRNGEEILTKGDRISIGSMDTEQRSFQNHEVDLQKGDCIYIYSDGYADQFGGERGKKMKTTIMRKKVLELSSLPIKQQKIELEKHLQEWQGLLDQVDDICVIGVRV
jgi:ligand-binding sensor domain-containing protein/serine phosphatase RsbU (regulator of sigma subunit)